MTTIVEYPFERVYRKLPFKECALAGAAFHLDEDDFLWDELRVGTRLALVRDKHNEHDSNAVAVALADDYEGDPDDFDFDFILGYVPRACNAELAAMMDAGYAEKFSAEISSYSRHGNINERIRLTIFIESAEPELVRPDLLRAMPLSLLELKRLTDELNERGTAYFRFGGYQAWEFPVVGEKIVMTYRDFDDEVLYLMRVIAAGDDCENFVNEDEEIDCDDDCEPFILANVMGPVRIKKTDWPILNEVDFSVFSSTKYLPQNLSDGFREIFQSQLPKRLSPNNIDMDPSIDE